MSTRRALRIPAVTMRQRIAVRTITACDDHCAGPRIPAEHARRTSLTCLPRRRVGRRPSSPSGPSPPHHYKDRPTRHKSESGPNNPVDRTTAELPGTHDEGDAPLVDVPSDIHCLHGQFVPAIRYPCERVCGVGAHTQVVAAVKTNLKVIDA